MLYHVEVRVTPRAGLLDPEGNAVQGALRTLGFESVESVRMGRAIHIALDAESESAAREQADLMCRKLLANPVTEDYQIAFEQVV